MSTNECTDAGLYPTNIKRQKICLFSVKGFCFLQIPTEFSNCVPMKNLQKKNAEILPASSCAENLSVLQEKICLYEISCVHRKQDFYLFLLMAGYIHKSTI
jgi:hypothetical protein